MRACQVTRGTWLHRKSSSSIPLLAPGPVHVWLVLNNCESLRDVWLFLVWIRDKVPRTKELAQPLIRGPQPPGCPSPPTVWIRPPLRLQFDPFVLQVQTPRSQVVAWSQPFPTSSCSCFPPPISVFPSSKHAERSSLALSPPWQASLCTRKIKTAWPQKEKRSFPVDPGLEGLVWCIKVYSNPCLCLTWEVNVSFRAQALVSSVLYLFNHNETRLSTPCLHTMLPSYLGLFSTPTEQRSSAARGFQWETSRRMRRGRRWPKPSRAYEGWRDLRLRATLPQT